MCLHGVKTMTKAKALERSLVRESAAVPVFLAWGATALVAQRAPSSLTLDQAIEVAQGNNPIYLSAQNDMAQAHWQTREAYAGFPAHDQRERLGGISGGRCSAHRDAGLRWSNRLGVLELPYELEHDAQREHDLWDSQRTC